MSLDMFSQRVRSLSSRGAVADASTPESGRADRVPSRVNATRAYTKYVPRLENPCHFTVRGACNTRSKRDNTTKLNRVVEQLHSKTRNQKCTRSIPSTLAFVMFTILASDASQGGAGAAQSCEERYASNIAKANSCSGLGKQCEKANFLWQAWVYNTCHPDQTAPERQVRQNHLRDEARATHNGLKQITNSSLTFADVRQRLLDTAKFTVDMKKVKNAIDAEHLCVQILGDQASSVDHAARKTKFSKLCEQLSKTNFNIVVEQFLKPSRKTLEDARRYEKDGASYLAMANKEKTLQWRRCFLDMAKIQFQEANYVHQSLIWAENDNDNKAASIRRAKTSDDNKRHIRSRLAQIALRLYLNANVLNEFHRNQIRTHFQGCYFGRSKDKGFFLKRFEDPQKLKLWVDQAILDLKLCPSNTEVQRETIVEAKPMAKPERSEAASKQPQPMSYIIPYKGNPNKPEYMVDSDCEETNTMLCSMCDGKKMVPWISIFKWKFGEKTCPDCNGTGARQPDDDFHVYYGGV